MQRAVLIFPAAALGLLAWMLATGADADMARWAAEQQRGFQNGLAAALRGLRAGEPGALALTTGLCFAYGVVHAIGPGHGKVLIGGYGLGRRVPLLRLSAIAMAASLGQAVTALAVVGLGVLVVGWSRTRATEVVEGLLAPASAIAVGLIGLWLVLRGARRLWSARPAIAAGPDPEHGHDGCGHRHGPTLAEVGSATGTREVAALIAGIAIRPCSGALLLLVLTWHMGILAAGVAGTLAMSLGTGIVTVVVAILAVTSREGTLRGFGRDRSVPWLMPTVEVAAGLAIALVALRLLSPG